MYNFSRLSIIIESSIFIKIIKIILAHLIPTKDMSNSYNSDTGFLLESGKIFLNFLLKHELL